MSVLIINKIFLYDMSNFNKLLFCFFYDLKKYIKLKILDKNKEFYSYFYKI